jgi:hypothetical protein
MMQHEAFFDKILIRYNQTINVMGGAVLPDQPKNSTADEKFDRTHTLF